MTTFRPAAGAVPVPPWSVAFLTQRDLALQLPVNYVTDPGVVFHKACFTNGVYETNAAVTCLSNLLATGFRHFFLDLYWDRGRRNWSFCPVEVPSGPQASDVSSAAAASTSTISVIRTDPMLIRKLDDAPHDEDNPAKRQTSTAITSLGQSAMPTSVTASVSTNASTTSVTPATATALNGNTLYFSGPFACSGNIDMSFFTNVLADYLRNSSTDLAATFNYLHFHLHVATSRNATMSTGPVLNGSALPQAGELLGSLLSAGLSSYLYTPALLRSDRSNLNDSWLGIPSGLRTDRSYFNASLDSRNILTTNNGWPSEGYAEFQKLYRLMAAIEGVDSQLAKYNLAADEQILFPPGYISAERAVSYDSDGRISDGCFYNPGTTSLPLISNSFAYTDDIQLSNGFTVATFNNTNNTKIWPSVSNVTTCGLSAALNQTLANSTADQDVNPYQSFVYSSIWSWAPGEPRNISDSDYNESRMRCALVDVATPQRQSGTPSRGRWKVADCTERYFAACRVRDEPYKWRISTGRATYSGSDETCPEGSSFAVPRTGLESRYMLAAVAAAENLDEQPSIWVNFNSLDRPGCWVTGIQATCPYNGGENASTGRQVAVPVVAAIIVLVLAALFLFIKLAANRKNKKRTRKRKGEDWVYEGVPA